MLGRSQGSSGDRPPCWACKLCLTFIHVMYWTLNPDCSRDPVSNPCQTGYVSLVPRQLPASRKFGSGQETRLSLCSYLHMYCVTDYLSFIDISILSTISIRWIVVPIEYITTSDEDGIEYYGADGTVRITNVAMIGLPTPRVLNSILPQTV